LKQVTISNEFITLIVLDYGATIQKLLVKGKDGSYTNVITDRSTVVNLTNHSYFKLDDSPFVDNNELQLNCPTTLETDKQLLPTGNQIPVRGTENDFLLSREIGIQRLDTPFVKDMGSEKVGELYSPKSGISMKVYTKMPFQEKRYY